MLYTIKHFQFWCNLNTCKGKGEKERYIHLNAEFRRVARRGKKAFLSDQCEEVEEKTQWERVESPSRKLEMPREYFIQRWAQ